MKKKNYVSPEIQRYNTADVICTSTTDPYDTDEFDPKNGGGDL